MRVARRKSELPADAQLEAVEVGSAFSIVQVDPSDPITAVHCKIAAEVVPGPDALPIVEDALRTNDTRLVTAAVGPYAARHLDAHNWRDAVLKCLFTGVPLDAVAELPRRARADFALARMLGDYADERSAAGRPVPEDLYRVLALTEPGSDLPTDSAPSDQPGTPSGKES